jgi:acyl carrier protein
MTAVADQIFEIIAKEAGIERERIALTSTLEDLQIESLDVVQIIFAIEEQFQVYMPYNNPAFDVETVGSLVETVERLLREKESA